MSLIINKIEESIVKLLETIIQSPLSNKEKARLKEFIEKEPITENIQKMIEHTANSFEKHIEELQFTKDLQKEEQEIKDMSDMIPFLFQAVENNDTHKLRIILQKKTFEYKDVKDVVTEIVNKKNWGMLKTYIRSITSDEFFSDILEVVVKAQQTELIKEVFKRWKDDTSFIDHCIKMVREEKEKLLITYFKFRENAKDILLEKDEFMKLIIIHKQINILNELWDENTFENAKEILPTGESVLSFALKNNMVWLSECLINNTDSLKGMSISDYFDNINEENCHIIFRLLDLDVDPNGLFQNGESIVTYCIKNNSIELLNKILQCNIKANEIDLYIEDLLSLAIENSSTQAIEQLFKNNLYNISPSLLECVKSQGIEMIKFFRQLGIKITLDKKDIQQAFESENWEIVLEIKKEINTKEVSFLIESTLFPNLKFSNQSRIDEYLNKDSLIDFVNICNTLKKISNKEVCPECTKITGHDDMWRWKFSRRGRIVESRIDGVHTIEEITATHEYDSINAKD